MNATSVVASKALPLAASLLFLVAFPRNGAGAAATLLFEDDFNRGIEGWTAVQPGGDYLDGPMRWQYDIVSGAFVEQSNIYSPAAAGSLSGRAVMLINEALAPAEFTYSARLTAGDDDGFGLIFGYRDDLNFYRIAFARQVRTGDLFPGNGWRVDRMVDGLARCGLWPRHTGLCGLVCEPVRCSLRCDRARHQREPVLVDRGG